MQLLDRISVPNKDGGFTDLVWKHPITRVIVTTTVVLILIIVAGVIMRIIKYTVKEYKDMRATMNISTSGVASKI